MTLLPQIDNKQTRKNARGVLKQYRKWQRIAGRPLVDIKSPIITDMPKSESVGNKAEDAIIERLTAEYERDSIVCALASLSMISRQILYYSYCDVDKRSNYEIGLLLRGYSEKNVEKLKSIALIEFAEAYKRGYLLSAKK